MTALDDMDEWAEKISREVAEIKMLIDGWSEIIATIGNQFEHCYTGIEKCFERIEKLEKDFTDAHKDLPIP